MTSMLALLLVTCVVISPAVGYPMFQKNIPNADRVPDPAQANILWQGVGHLNANGGGPRNVFGTDFHANKLVWDKVLCQKDSDGDGLTNGQELGDPDCEWIPGKTPKTNIGLSHPGICEPIEDKKCKDINKGVLFRSAEPFDCPATKEADVKSSVYRYKVTEVPAKETNYFCQYFPLDIPDGTSEHIIAFEPVIDNVDVMHHTIVYACRAEGSLAMANYTSPQDCSRSMSSCQEVLLLWTVGLNGQCYPKEFGGLIGEGGYTGIWMEHHWNNPQKIAGMTDSSGIKIYHTPNKRPADAAWTLWGTLALELPPAETNMLQFGGCPYECTKDFKEEIIYISQITPHMHYLGRAMTVSINGKQILEDRTYSYDSPKSYTFDPPLEMKRGDEVQVNCTFTTTSATKRTYGGAATSDEMCLAVSLMYPMDSSVPTDCSATNGAGFCHDKVVGDWGCDLGLFFASADWEAWSLILAQSCDSEGVQCWDGCREAIQEVEKMEPCFASKGAQMIRMFLAMRGARELLNYMLSCQEIIYDTKMVQVGHDDHDKDNGCQGAVCDGASTVRGPVVVVVALAIMSSIVQFV